MVAHEWQHTCATSSHAPQASQKEQTGGFVTFPLSTNISQTDPSLKPAVHGNRKSLAKFCLCPGLVQRSAVGWEEMMASGTDSTSPKQQLGGELF